VEDDGLVLSTLLYGGKTPAEANRTSLLILNAKSWEIMAKVDMFCESPVPKCFHGWFFSDVGRTGCYKPQMENANDELLENCAELN